MPPLPPYPAGLDEPSPQAINHTIAQLLRLLHSCRHHHCSRCTTVILDAWGAVAASSSLIRSSAVSEDLNRYRVISTLWCLCWDGNENMTTGCVESIEEALRLGIAPRPVWLVDI
ncbi:unnamed protein product [Microthlaspi erraticum]|uniref:Uncharacterized protein n=1 Tax=Microthlaspi erraticum TaxID=1685480 RepID=A0A6D2J0P5_9BRAS|nr:unnamed protein product [Microthlaspi erraticum]